LYLTPNLWVAQVWRIPDSALTISMPTPILPCISLSSHSDLAAAFVGGTASWKSLLRISGMIDCSAKLPSDADLGTCVSWLLADVNRFWLTLQTMRGAGHTGTGVSLDKQLRDLQGIASTSTFGTVIGEQFAEVVLKMCGIENVAGASRFEFDRAMKVLPDSKVAPQLLTILQPLLCNSSTVLVEVKTSMISVLINEKAASNVVNMTAHCAYTKEEYAVRSNRLFVHCILSQQPPVMSVLVAHGGSSNLKWTPKHDQMGKLITVDDTVRMGDAPYHLTEAHLSRFIYEYAEGTGMTLLQQVRQLPPSPPSQYSLLWIASLTPPQVNLDLGALSIQQILAATSVDAHLAAEDRT
jgi:hypothetical protein